MPGYRRQRREGPLSFSTKMFQGIGAVPDTVKNWVFSTFLLLYYNQILGVNAVHVSVALAIALVIDALSDPLVASLSDNLRTRGGRRHPFMLAASIPLGASLFAVFVPPAGLSSLALVAWLLTFTVLTRTLMTFFFVPWAAIAAELSDDYDERTSVMAFRFAVGWTVGVLFPLWVFTAVMPGTEAHPVGQLNPAGYPQMALWAGFLVSAGALASTLLTWREVPYLRQHAEPRPRPGLRDALVTTFRELRRALENRQFALIFIIVIVSAAIGGTTANINVYMATFFWGLTSEDLRWFPLAAIGAILAFPFVASVQRRWDKKEILFSCGLASLLLGIAPVSLRFLDWLPRNGEPALLAILIAGGAVVSAVAVIQGIIGASIVADILDDHELRTRYRQEAMFSAALSFSGKAISGLGIVLGGVLLEMIHFPRNAAPAEVAAETIFHLGLVVGVAVPLLYLIPIGLITRYRITREVHAEIQEQLRERRAAESSSEVGLRRDA